MYICLKVFFFIHYRKLKMYESNECDKQNYKRKLIRSSSL